MTSQADDWQSENGAEFEDYAREYGTPYYFYDADRLVAQVGRVKAAFEDAVDVYYAVKANPNLKLLEAIRPHIDGLDISSVGELEQALLAGYDADRMSFAGPAKTPAELARAIECDVGSISMESEREMRAAADIARQSSRPAHITFRVNPTTDPRAFGLKMGGRPVQFGIDQENLESAVELLNRCADQLDFRGVHIYAGSQGFDFTSMAQSFKATLDVAECIESMTGRPVRKINLGGGFGISHVSADKALDLEALADAVRDPFAQFRAGRSEPVDLIFELGRYLVADAGIYVTRVIGIKESRGKKFAVTDGGLHHHLAAAGNFGVGFRSNYPVLNLTHPDAPIVDCSIAGPSCNPTDLLGQNTKLADPREGDLLAVLSSGSYGLTASPLLFLGRPTPAELVRSGGDTQLGRRRRDILDFN